MFKGKWLIRIAVIILLSIVTGIVYSYPHKCKRNIKGVMFSLNNPDEKHDIVHIAFDGIYQRGILSSDGFKGKMFIEGMEYLVDLELKKNRPAVIEKMEIQSGDGKNELFEGVLYSVGNLHEFLIDLNGDESGKYVIVAPCIDTEKAKRVAEKYLFK